MCGAHFVGQQTVQTDAREDERQQGESTRYLRHQAVQIKCLVDLLSEK